MALLHSLHLTTPISEVDVKGRAPNIFISLAESQDVGGDATADGSTFGSHDDSKVKGDVGAVVGFNLMVIVRGSYPSRVGQIMNVNLRHGPHGTALTTRVSGSSIESTESSRLINIIFYDCYGYKQ